MKKRVMVAMSGGVDSSVAAALLIDQGYEVIGVTMWLFDGQSDQVVKDAKAVCDHLAIDHHVLDLRQVFKEKIITYFKESYLAGLTPNPCAKCNEQVKFGLLLDHMRALGCAYFATGHYAVVENHGGTYRLRRAKTDRKDQVYFLHTIKKEDLSCLLFPLGQFDSKDAVRQLAKDYEIPVATKKDSDGLCFAGGMAYGPYLTSLVKDLDLSGDFIGQEGQVLGHHSGYFNYTLGQKKGLGIQLEKNHCVVAIDPATKQVVIGHESQTYHQALIMEGVNWLEDLVEDRVYDVKMFNWGYRLRATIKHLTQGYMVTFDQPVRAIAPGQYLVVYNQDYVVGGGTITCVVT